MSAQSVLALYVPEPNTGCWLWTGAVDRDGYGKVKHEGKWQLAHRVVWRLLRGPIPAGLVLRHQCRQRCCVNPGHILLGTKADNGADTARDGVLRGPRRQRAA